MSDPVSELRRRSSALAEWASNNRRTVTIMTLVALVIVVLGTIQALLPDRIAGQLPDQALTAHSGVPRRSVTGQQLIVGAGVQQIANVTYVTVHLGANATSAVLTLNFPSTATTVTLFQGAGANSPWSANVTGAAAQTLAPIGAAAAGADVVISLHGHVAPLTVTTPSGDQMPTSGELTATTPPTGVNLLDVVLLVLLMGAVVIGWRRGLRSESRLAVATVVTLALAFALYPIVRSVLAGANGSRVGDAISYGLLLAVMSLAGLFVARALEPRIATWRGPQWSARTRRALSAALSGARVMLVAAAVMSILSGVANFNAAAGAIETSLSAHALVHSWETAFPVTTVAPSAGTQPSLATSGTGPAGSSGGPCAPGDQPQSITMTNVATGAVTNFTCGGPGGYASTPASKYYSYFNEYLAMSGVGIQLVVTGPPITAPVNCTVSSNLGVVNSSHNFADVDFYDNATGVLDYATAGRVSLSPNGTVVFHHVKLVFNGATFNLSGTMFAPAPGAVVNNRAVVAAQYVSAVATTNALVKSFNAAAQRWTTATSNATAQNDAASLVTNLTALPAQLRHFATLYPPAATALTSQIAAVTTLTAALNQLSNVQSIGVANWVSTYNTDLRALVNASKSVRSTLGLSQIS